MNDQIDFALPGWQQRAFTIGDEVKSAAAPWNTRVLRGIESG